jgi:hypothetical protein
VDFLDLKKRPFRVAPTIAKPRPFPPELLRDLKADG